MKSEVMFVGRLVIFLIAIISLAGCSVESSAQNSSVPQEVAKQVDDLQKLRAAEYDDFTNGIGCEESNKKLGTYYFSKGLQAHDLILQEEEGHQIRSEERRVGKEC